MLWTQYLAENEAPKVMPAVPYRIVADVHARTLLSGGGILTTKPAQLPDILPPYTSFSSSRKGGVDMVQRQSRLTSPSFHLAKLQSYKTFPVPLEYELQPQERDSPTVLTQSLYVTRDLG
eukprot:g8212.t1